MDGKGRSLDNVYIERFWRTIKYDEIYLKDYENMEEAKRMIGKFISKYNEERPHALLDGLTPVMFYDMIKLQGERELNPLIHQKKAALLSNLWGPPPWVQRKKLKWDEAKR